jgi:tetraacyldisaccharide 4'-kinase
VHLLSFDIFTDHHRYSEKEIEELKTVFIKSDADYLVTTEKDAMRLQNHSAFLKSLFILRVKMEIKPSVQSFENFIMGEIKTCKTKQKG